jgi:hypothetical protein
LLTVPVSAVNTAVNRPPIMTTGLTPNLWIRKPVSGPVRMDSRPRTSRALEITPRLHLTSGSIPAISGPTTKYTAPTAVPYSSQARAPCW